MPSSYHINTAARKEARRARAARPAGQRAKPAAGGLAARWKNEGSSGPCHWAGTARDVVSLRARAHVLLAPGTDVPAGRGQQDAAGGPAGPSPTPSRAHPRLFTAWLQSA